MIYLVLTVVLALVCGSLVRSAALKTPRRELQARRLLEAEAEADLMLWEADPEFAKKVGITWGELMNARAPGEAKPKPPKLLPARRPDQIIVSIGDEPDYGHRKRMVRVKFMDETVTISEDVDWWWDEWAVQREGVTLIDDPPSPKLSGAFHTIGPGAEWIELEKACTKAGTTPPPSAWVKVKNHWEPRPPTPRPVH